MTWWLILIVLYCIGWLTFVLLNKSDAHDYIYGGLLVVTGIVWPIHLLGWLVSR